MIKSENIKRRRKALAQAMKQRQRIEDDSDLIDLVYERMANNDGEFIELDLREGLKVKTDMVNNPPHYKDASGVGCTEVVKHMMYFGGACFKYLYRCGNKWDDIEDLKKAVRCAELADDDRFITDESWLRAVYQVASHRDGNVRDAMFNIRSQQWEYVIEYIKAEIARLESEANDD